MGLMTSQSKVTLLVAVVLVVGLVLTAVLTVAIYARDEREQRQQLRADLQELQQQFMEFEYRTRLYHSAVENNFEQKMEYMAGLKEYIEGKETISWEDFKDYVLPIEERHPGTMGIFWVARIEVDAASRLDELATATAPPGFELDLDDHGSSSTEASSTTDSIWPIYFAAPLESNRKWLGQNAEQHPVFSDVFEGRSDNEGAWTSIAFSAEGKSRPEDVFIAINLSDGRSMLRADGEDTAFYNSGFIATLINLPELLKTAVEKVDAQPLKIFLYDDEGRLLATHGDITDRELDAGETINDFENAHSGETFINRELEMSGIEQQWQMYFKPNLQLGVSIPEEHSGANSAWYVAAGGLLLTFVLSGAAYRVVTEMARKDKSVEEHQRLAQRDGLTGLLNRRALNEHLTREWEGARRSGRQLSVIILDLDRFKAMNDTYGHAAGDTVLQDMATILQGVCRKSDVATRYGGEEFCLLLPGTDMEEAVAVAERIRRELSAHSFTVSGEKAVHVTCSAGVATQQASEESQDALLERADQALYRAKNEGRNRVVSASPDAEAM